MKNIKSLLLALLLVPALSFGQATGKVITNKPSGGSIGTAATTVDVVALFNVNQTTAGQTLTVPNLTNASAGKIIYISNTGSVSFDLLPGGLVEAGHGIILRWDGAQWSNCGGATQTLGSVLNAGNTTDGAPITSGNGNSVLNLGNFGTSYSYNDGVGNQSSINLDGKFVINVSNEKAGQIDSAGVGSKHNTTYGLEAGESITSGTWNSLFGKWAGKSITTGTANSMFGLDAGYLTTTGNNNVFIGEDAGFVNTTGGNNIFIGVHAGYSTTTTSGLVGIGNASLEDANGGGFLTAVGNSSLTNNTSGENSSAFGSSAGYGNTTGNENSYFGVESGGAGNSSRNYFFGAYTAANSSNSGGNNGGFGYQSGYNLNGGSENLGLGSYTLRSLATGNQNTAAGMFGGYAATGSNNLFLGYFAGRYQTAINGKIYIGTRDYTNSTYENSRTPIVISSHATDSSQTIINLNGKVKPTVQMANSSVVGTDASGYLKALNLSGASISNDTLIVSGGSGTVTSVGLALGTSGTDLGISGSPVTTSGNITLNVPDASATARGVVTTGTQTIAGSKTFTGTTTFTSGTADRATYLNGSKELVTSNVSSTELGYVDGVTSSIQNQLDTLTAHALGYTIITTHAAFNPADGVTYYFGAFPTLSPIVAGYADSAKRIFPPARSRLVKAEIHVINATSDGSNENATIYVRKNNTTDVTLSSSVKYGASTVSGLTIRVTGLNVTFNGTTDFLVSKLVCPTWATNPQGAITWIQYYFEHY